MMRGSFLPCFFEKEKIAGGPQGPPVIFSDNKVHTINIVIHFQIKLKNFLGPKILSFIILKKILSPMINIYRTQLITRRVSAIKKYMFIISYLLHEFWGEILDWTVIHSEEKLRYI